MLISICEMQSRLSLNNHVRILKYIYGRPDVILRKVYYGIRQEHRRLRTAYEALVPLVIRGWLKLPPVPSTFRFTGGEFFVLQ
jgi:hypothetical protein